MKLTTEEYVDHEFDVIQMIEDLKKQHHTIYWTHIYNNLYVYKPLGRKDYKEISENEELDNASKEDEVIKRCLLYPNPDEFDIDNIEAGIIVKLVKTIMENSYLSDIETRVAIMDYFRSEMFDFQEQVTCIINEAFPQYDIEEIENWGIERTAKYLSRAEWKLQNLRGLTMNEELMHNMQQAAVNNVQNEREETSPSKSEAKQEKSSGKQRMTPEKLAELKAKFPEIDWDADVIANEGIDGMRDSVDSTAVALRSY